MDNTTRETILDTARQYVCTDREGQYGSPENNFALIAEMWEAYFRAACVSSDAIVGVGGEDVAVMMALLKIARIATGNPKADNYIDLAGYAACAGEIACKAEAAMREVE